MFFYLCWPYCHRCDCSQLSLEGWKVHMYYSWDILESLHFLFQNCSCTSYCLYDLLADYVAREYALHRDFTFQSTTSSGNKALTPYHGVGRFWDGPAINMHVIQMAQNLRIGKLLWYRSSISPAPDCL